MLTAALLNFWVIGALFRMAEGRYGFLTLWSVYPWGIWALHAWASRKSPGKLKDDAGRAA